MNDVQAVAGHGVELPLAQIPSIPGWNENYCWTAFDPKHRISMYVHNGRWFRDTSLWHEVILICRDGTDYFVRRNIGRLRDPSVLGATCLEMRCVEPFKHWDWTYNGPVLRGSVAGMTRTPPVDSDARLLKFALTWMAAGPIVDFGHGTEPGAAGSHYEQGGLLHGTLQLDGDDIAFEGRSFRDHSRGPRLLQDNFDGHFWLHGTFPSGRTISSLIVRKPGGGFTVCDLFFVEQDGRIEVAKFDRPDALLPEGRDDFTAPFTVNATLGEHKISLFVRPQFIYPVSLAAPMDMYLGQSSEFDSWRIFQLPVHLSWEGEQTYGHLELGLSKYASRRYQPA